MALLLSAVCLPLFMGCGGDERGAFDETDAGLTTVRLRLNWTLYGEHAFFVVGTAKGFYREEGLDVEILEGSGSSTTVKLVGNGTDQIGYADAGTVMRGIAAGVPVKVVGVVLQKSPMSVIYRADSPIATAEALRGKRVAVTAGDANSQIFPAVLARNGLTERDLTLVAVASPMAKETMLLERKVDAFLGYFIEQPLRLEERTGQKMAWTTYAELGVNTLSSSIFVNESTLEAHPEVVERFLRATMRALEYTIAHPAEAAAAFSARAPSFSPDLAEREISGMVTLLRTPNSAGKPLGWTAEADWRATQELLARYGGLRPQEDVGVYFTNDLLPP